MITKWQDMDTAPKGGGADRVDDPKWIEPPEILAVFDTGQMAIIYWDWYYAPGGFGHTGKDAWIVQHAGLAEDEVGNPIAWMHLPKYPL